MLFVNFLCLLYLMLLVNGLTVSKNIDNSYFDERVDSLHDLEYTTRYKSKHDKFLHKHRRIKSGVTTPTSKIPVRVTTPQAKSTEATYRPQHYKLHKSTKRRIGGFWRKFKIKEDKALEREKRLKYQFQRGNLQYKRPPYGIGYEGIDKKLVTKRKKNTHPVSFEKKKREVKNEVTNILNKQKDEKTFKNVEVNITPYENFSSTVKETTHMKAISTDEELKKVLNTMTTKVAELKHLYGLEKYKPNYPSTHKVPYTTKPTTTQSTTENLDIPGTAQLEALLNDIKEKALHLIVEQNPDITDLITNTVTEATFEADPLLTHLEINSPPFSLYTLITLNSDFGKRDTNITKFDDEKSTVVEISTNYNREGRSVAEDAMTAAQSIEDILQKEMKNIYKKVKNKVSGDFRKEVEKVKTTLKPRCNKTCSKDPPAKQRTNTKPATEINKKSKSTTQLQQNRVDRKSGKHTKVTEQELTTTPTADDYALLTLYEQMLTKTCQNNIMNMVTSQDRIKRNKRNKKLVSKRNFETLFDQNLKEDVKKMYEDREDIPDDLEYNFEVNIPEVTTAETATEPDYSQTAINEAQSQNEMDDGNTEMTPYDDNSYEGLSSKISYNEFVNGYKHYLNFQKEQANDKFSNLIRYQAHRHHSVDDIGKYILNKIPQLPSRDKRFFEYEDDHDSSTKSEESWFKKHFYMFIDNGTPKKYHKSQTVSLKSPTPEPYEKSGRKIEDSERSELEDKLRVTPEAEDNAVDINLEKLSQVLEEHKATPAAIPVQENAFKDTVLKNAGKRHGHIFKSFTPPRIIHRVFGKDHKTLEGSDVESNNPGLISNSLEAGYLKQENNKNINFLFTNELNRKKRNTKEPKEKPTTFGQNLTFQTKKSAKLINLTKKKTDNAKIGCVDIGLVVPPTAIVKLRGTKRKESKLKKLLQKLHLAKSNKKVKRNNRSTKYMRKQRSNPFQKLKNIFKSTPKSKVLKAGSHLSDYDIMSSHIDTFKPMKYNKVLDIEEMKKQIPNITAEIGVDASAKYANRVTSWKPRTTEKGLTDFTVLLNTTLTSLHMSPATNSPSTKTTKKSKSHNIENLLKINVETKSSSGPYKQIISFPQHMSLNDIKDQVENIFIKITSDPSNKINPTVFTTESKYLMNNKMPINKDILKFDINSFYTKVPKMKKYSKPNSKIRPNSEIHTILDLEQNSEFVEDDSYGQTSKPKFNVNEINAQSPVFMLIPTESLLTLGHSVHDEEKEKYKPYPDYFSDLLMWNKDILNSDKVPSPWRDILKNMNRELDYTTPDISDIQQELIQINDGSNVNVNSLKETPLSTYSHKGITPRNWLQNVVVEKPPIGKSILIEQEKKFVKFDPKITDRHLKAADFVNELNKFAKTFSDETKYKLNKIHAVPENYLGNKENKDQSAILVDTTLLAYDDDVNYISTLTPRELSKNALKSANVENKAAASLKAKTNKQPVQYFATPLPMKMTDFEEFLKANRLDVESVTSPIVGLPTINAYASKKSSRAQNVKKVRPTITKKKQKPTRTKTKLKSHERRVTKESTLSIVNNMKESENQFDYLNDLETDLFNDYKLEEKERFKRYNVHYNSYFTNINQDINQWSKTDKDMQKHKPAAPKQFINKESDLKSNDIAETTEDMTAKDFEITIINFGDINKLTDEYAPIQTDTTTEKSTKASDTFLKNAIKTPLSVDFIEKGSKDSDFLHKLHNDLFYDHAYTKSKETTTGVTETIKIEETTMPTPPLAFHEAVWKKMPLKTNHEPKRVRISSQSYKYDIIYHHPEKNKKDRGTHLPSYIITTEVTTPEELYPSYNSDFVSAGESDVARGDCGKKRLVRKVKISSEKSATGTKYSPTSTLNPKTKKHSRHHKLKRFFPVIQDKLRIFSKNSSAYSDFLQRPSTIILSSTSVNSKEKTTNKGNIKKTDKEVLYDGRVANDYNKKDKDDARRIKIKSVYLDTSHSQNPTEMSNVTDVYNYKDYINKREIQSSETHTAKDVAALEVIVDMMKNPLKGDENNKNSPNIQNNNAQSNDKVNANTNSIQVHIAVPYEIENCKKRSLEAVKVRKVFTAKLSTPVDIEYQVHSLEGPPTTQTPVDDLEGLSPGVYLLVGNTYFPQGVALKPVIPNNVSAMKVRQIKTTTEKMTSTIPTKNLAKVTLSKDFISAINKQLITLYNLTRMNNNKCDVANNSKGVRTKRSINWDLVNKIFGHDKVCNCKCKVNKTMCKACAASEAVMSELIFEFENLFTYMNEHCTEIQAYFVANPRGGKRLKDSVHKIDQNLRDYYKRVKGKCQGRTCITFATLTDERELHKNYKRSKDAGHNFINDLEAIAKDIEKATKTVTCFKENLEDEVKKLKHIINNCILLKSHDKRSDINYRQSKDIKNVYSLDGVNVNIICNTESTIPYITLVSPHNHDKNVWVDTEYKEKKSKGFKDFLSRFRSKKKDNALGEYLKQMNKTFDKREIQKNKIESPLISDTGGSFWHDYIQRCSGEPKYTRSKLKIEAQTEHEPKAFSDMKDSNMELIKKEVNNNILATTADHTGNIGHNNFSDNEKLLNNINQFIKLFSNVDERQITKYTENPPSHKQTMHKTKSKKIKHKKPKCKVHKTVKTKMHKITNSTNEINIPKNPTTPHGYSKIESTPINIRVTKTLNIFKIKSMFKTTKPTTTQSTTVTKTDFFKKIKMVTSDFFKKIGKTNMSQNTDPVKREHNLCTTIASTTKLTSTYASSTQNGINVISEPTTESNSNIIIIDDIDELTSNNYKDLLLSIIDYESNKLNKEWMRFANINLDKTKRKQTTGPIMTTKKSKGITRKKDSTDNYDILQDLQPLFPAVSNETETTISMSALIDKIGSKFKFKFVNNNASTRTTDKKVHTQKKPNVGKKTSTKKKAKTQPHTTSAGREAVDSAAEPRICNIKATRQHILDIRREMPIKDFEEYISNVTCQKYDSVPKAIFLGRTRYNDNKNIRKWYWIRDRRSLFRSKSKPKGSAKRISRVISSEFEVFYRGEHGIYKQKMRRKRCAGSRDDINELRNLPRFYDSENEIYALAGDTVNISCFNDSKQSINDRPSAKYAWKAERDGMLDYNNVVVDGDLINIVDVQAKNNGYYNCKNSGIMKRDVKLTVLTLPNLVLLSTLLYRKETECIHDDLKRLQLLGPEISKELFQRQSDVHIDSPVCLEDKADGKIKIKALASVYCRRPAVDCSVSCRRDLQGAFASMCAENVPTLATIEVVLLKDGVNYTWRPTKYNKRSVITRSLRDIGSRHDIQYPKEPGSLKLLVSCPAGYRLLSRHKVCAACPEKTFAREGDNACSMCPRGSYSAPGADRCAVTRSRRYDWWMCPPCGYGVAAVVALCCCGVCVALALIVHVTSRSCGNTDNNAKELSELPKRDKFQMNPGPTRSSRVILAKFFKPSLTSSMATDSQETKFDTWKARNRPPPLPPVDFDS